MRKGTKRSSIQPKSKEQLWAEMKKSADFKERMKFIKEEFWPALNLASQNIEDASMLLTGFSSQIMESFLLLMKEKKVAELQLENKLDKNSLKYKENQDLIALFSDMDVLRAKEVIEGMKHEIELFKREEMESRPLSSLKVKWADEL